MQASVTLRAAIGPYAHLRALRTGAVVSPRIAFEFVDVAPIVRAFPRMLRAQEFDVCEMAVTALAQAHAFGKPVAGLSAVVMRGFHHGALQCPVGSPLHGPRDVVGRRIGVRSWSQTTGVWVRAILRHEYGVRYDAMTWVTEEGSHVAEFRDPPFVTRAPAEADLATMLLDGRIDAGIALRGMDAGKTRSVIPDADAAAADWFRRTGIYPVNHVMSVRRELLEMHPWLAGELMALFAEAKRVAPPVSDPVVGADPLPYGLAANKSAIETAMRFAAEQGLIPRAYAAEELFAA
ncbi:MAG TPA: ABC transporter substrate-binding protein [Acetobacteraceae bacterium]